MIVKRKYYSWFSNNKIDIFDFLELLKTIKYPYIHKSFDPNGKDEYGDITFYTFYKIGKLNSSQSDKVRDSFNNLKDNIYNYIKSKNMGTVNDWELYAAFIESKNNKLSLYFSFISKKDIPNVCEKGSIFDYEIKL